MNTPRARESGLVLVNVLVILTLAASVVFLMLSGQQSALEGVRLRAAASQAERLAEGGEASVVTALRRDMAEAPQVDHLAEAWAAAAQEEVRLSAAGRFSVALEDLQGRFDLNRLGGAMLSEGPVFDRLLAALSVPPETGARIADFVRRTGPLKRLEEVRAAGVSDTDLDRLLPHVTVLEAPLTINLNTVGPPLLGALLRDPVAARRMIGIRERKGFLVAEDLSAAGLLQPVGTDFTSQTWRSTVRAEVDGITRVLQSRILRRPDAEPPGVFVTERQWIAPGAATPPPLDSGLGARLLRP